MYGGSSPRSSAVDYAVNNLAGPQREQGEWRRAYPSAHPWRGVEHPRAGVGRVWHCGSSGTTSDGLAAHILVEGRCVHGDSISLPLAKINDACHCGRCQIGHRCSGPSAPPVVAVRGPCQMALRTRATFSWWGPVRAMSWAPAKGRAKDGRRSAKHRMAALRQKRQDKANQLSYFGTIHRLQCLLGLVRVVCAIRFGEGTRAPSKVVQHFRNTEENERFGVFVNTPHSSPLSSAP